MWRFKNRLGAALKKLIRRAVELGSRGKVGRYLYAQVLDTAMAQTQVVNHCDASLVFSTPNWLNKYRAETFSTKEPETLDWIDQIPRGSVFWDIGANVGLYTCYAAKSRNCRVFAFEPSVFNLELLARNIFLNGLTDQVTIVPLPLSDKLAFSKLNMSSTEWGGALSTFAKSYGYDGKDLDKKFEFSTIGLSIDDAIQLIRIPRPDYIKMDVDGIEHLILKGGSVVLKCAEGVLVEINDDFPQQALDAANFLSTAGLVLKDKRRWSESINTPFASTYNQIWRREAVC